MLAEVVGAPGIDRARAVGDRGGDGRLAGQSWRRPREQKQDDRGKKP